MTDEKRGGFDFYRLVIAVMMVSALALTLSWLQGRFDTSDHEKALKLINTYRARPNGPTISEVILAKHRDLKEHQLAWSTEITSGCLGIVRATALVPKRESGDAVTYSFDVRLTDPSIHPTDPATIEILKALNTATTSTTTR